MRIVNLKSEAAESYETLLNAKPEVAQYDREQLLKLGKSINTTVWADEASGKNYNRPYDNSYGDFLEGSYKILAGKKNALGSMSTYREPRARQISYWVSRGNHACAEIESLAKLLQGDKAAVVVMFYCMIQSTGGSTNGGRIKATRDRDITTADLVKMTGMSKKTVLAALKKLDDLGLVRGYHDIKDSRKVHYLINPLYWAGISGKSGRKIDWIDWIVFNAELMPLVCGENPASSFAFRDLTIMAYYHACKPEEVKAMRRVEVDKQEGLFDLAPAAAAETEPETVAAPAEESATAVLDPLAVASAAVVEDPAVAAFIDSLDWDKLAAVQEKAKREPEKRIELKKDIDVDDLDDVARKAIFDALIVHHEDGKPYNYIIKGRSGNMVPTQTYSDKMDMYFQVNMDSTAFVAKKYSNDEIDTVNAWYIDIDGGKDKDGKYWGETEIAIRKLAMRRVIATLPTPTAVVATRNGYHVYWAVSEEQRGNTEDWKRAETHIHDLLHDVVDSAVKDLSRILRVPYSVWHKPETGLPKYETMIVYAAPATYTADTLIAAFDDHKDEIDTVADLFRAKYPDLARKNKDGKSRSGKTSRKSNSAAAHVDKVVITRGNVSPIHGADSERIRKIQAGRLVHLADYAVPRTVDSVIDAIKRVNIADFLGVDCPNHFSDLLHIDNNPSAWIKQQSDGTYVYGCASATSPANGGWDLIDVVAWIQGTDQRRARKYLQRCLNIKGISKYQKKLEKVG